MGSSFTLGLVASATGREVLHGQEHTPACTIQHLEPQTRLPALTGPPASTGALSSALVASPHRGVVAGHPAFGASELLAFLR